MHPHRLVALKAFPYGRLKLTPGQQFDASSGSDYRLLTEIGFAQSADAPDPPAAPTPAPASLPGPAVSEGPRPGDRLPEPAAEPDHAVTIDDAITGPPAASERVVVPPGDEARPMTTQTIRQRPGKYARKDLKAER